MAQRLPVTTPNLTELKRIIKKEETSSGNRLPTWGLQRDLNLTGIKPKKVYTPNLNTIRNKNKSNHIPNNNERTRGQKRTGHKLPHDNNKRGKFIETDGIFSTGMGKTTIKSPSTSANRTYFLRDKSSPKTKLFSNLSNPEDHTFTNSSDEESESEDELSPIIYCNDSNILKRELNIKEETIDTIKKESNSYQGDFEDKSGIGSSVNSQLQSQTFKEEQNVVSFLDGSKEYDEDNPAISLIRLPESFIDIADNKSTSADESPTSIHLKDLPEGQIGKIVIRKSGKMEMLLQNTKTILKREVQGDDPEFAMLLPGSQSISMEPSIVTLGEITEKFILTPEWSKLLDQVKREDPFFW